MYFTLPILIFSALAHKWDTPFLAREFMITGIGTLVIILGTGVIVAIYLKTTKQQEKSVLYPTVMFINAGNLALSLDYFAFGYDGFLRGVLFQVVNTSLMYSLGVYMVGRHLNIKTILKVPFIYAAIAGTTIWVFHIELPEYALRGVEFLGNAALPVLVLMLGYSLKNVSWSDRAGPHVGLFAQECELVGHFAGADGRLPAHLRGPCDRDPFRGCDYEHRPHRQLAG
jgi:predicted permease